MELTMKPIDTDAEFCAAIFELGRIHAINSGGCCYVAYALAKRFDLEAVALYDDNQYSRFENNIKNISTLNGVFYSAAHVVVIYKNKLYDAFGEFSQITLSKYKLHHKMNLTQIKKMLTEGVWNSEFNLKNIDLIEQITKTNIKDDLQIV